MYSSAKKAFETATQAAKRFGNDKSKEATNKPARLFDLSLTDEQSLMRETLRRFSAEAIRPNAEHADSDIHPPQSFFDAFAELGAVSFTIPESLGGATDEVSSVSNMLVAEDLAWGDMGLALAALSPLSLVHALARWGNDAQRDRYLAPYTRGEYPHAAFAMLEATPSFDPSALKTTLTGRSGKLTLRGQKVLVPLGATASTFLVAAKSSLGSRLVIVDRDAEGVSVKPTPAMGLRSAGLSTVSLKDVRVNEAMLLGGSDIDKPAAKSMFAECIERQSVAWGALSIGNSQAILDYVIPYANDADCVRRAYFASPSRRVHNRRHRG